MLNGKKVIIFDMDGTLIDSVGIWNQVDTALIRQISTVPNPCTENVQAQRDRVLCQFSTSASPYMEYCAYLRDTYRSALSADEIHTLRYQIAQEYLVGTIDYKKDADTFIRKLKSAGYTLVIATTTKKSNMEIYRTKNLNIINKANLDDYFSLIYTREDAREIKPNPEIYLRVMRELGVSAKECLVFEDSLIGIEAAKRAGIESVAVYDIYSDADREAIHALADYRIDSYTELLECV